MATVIDFPSVGRSGADSVATPQAGVSSLWDEEFIRRHDVAGPRYTSYPTALQFHEEFTLDEYHQAVQFSNSSRRPLSIYVHLPFCASLCYYCACNKIVTQDRSKVRTYLDHLITEIRLKASDFGRNRPVYQMHWGGGTPNYLDDSELTELMYQLGRHFNLVDGERSEYSIEIDPRTINEQRLGLLRGLGFNRLSFGIQDFDPVVQRGINRVQTFEMVEGLVEASRSYRFKSINLDLIYGLPYQTVATVEDTLAKVIALSPDRLSLFNYAHLPARFKSQALLDEAALPSPDEKLRILCLASRLLSEAGYVYIGMDHFAKPDDDLAVAASNGQLHRNFQGYTTCREADLVGLGVSAISQFGNVYCQNSKSITTYQTELEQQHLPVQAGLVLSHDDIIRRDVIMELICGNRLDMDRVGTEYGIAFDAYFVNEIMALKSMCAEGLLAEEGRSFVVTPRGRLVVRRICMVFDKYMPEHLRSGRHFSRVL